MADSFTFKVRRKLNRMWLNAAAGPVSRSCDIDPGKVVFISNYGRGFSCNPKYIAAEMHERGVFDDLVWLVNESDEDSLPDWVRPVRYETTAALRELASARVWVDNCRGTRYVRKKPGQFYVQAWHASISPKRVEGDVEDSLDENYVRDARIDGAETDLMFANNAFYEGVYKRAFWYDGPVLRCGVPRNAPIVHRPPELRSSVFRRYGIDESMGLCLYAPTFRKSTDLSVYEFDHARVLAALRARFGRDFALGVRLHPNIAHMSSELGWNDAVDMTWYEDAQELIAVADVLISDYSSVIEDHVLTGMPQFVYAPDVDSYLDDRGFYYPLEERGAAVATSSDELVLCIEAFDQSAHEARVKEFLGRFGVEDDGNGAKAVVDYILDSVRGVSL